MTITAVLKYNKNLFFSILTGFISIIYTEKVNAQVFDSEQNPPSVRFRQINTDNFQIIFPTEAEVEAQRMANTLEHLISRVSYSLHKTPRKISVILQNQGTVSNGFVQLAPRRSEFFTTPSQNFDYQNWLNSLAVHELRHVVQFDKVTGYLRPPLFESLALSIFGTTLPSWFYEGDAVVTETALTKAGRGRLPEWNIALRTNLVSGSKFSYSKEYLGSVKDFTSGYYQLGFFMNSTLRRSYGLSTVDSVLTRVSKLPIRPYGFSNSVKKYTGLTTNKLYNATANELRSLWNNQLEKVHPITYDILNKRNGNTPENFNLPITTSKGEILFLKQSKSVTPGIYKLDAAGNARRLFSIGGQEIPWFNYSSGLVVWDEFRYDPRYQKRSFNVLNIHDLKTGKSRQLTHRTRLFAPSLSHDGKTIVAVEISYSNEISLVEVSPESGAVLRRYKSPENYMLQMPSFDDSGEHIAVAGIGMMGKTIFELDRKTGKFTQLFPLQLQEILRPVYAGNQILFKAHFNGIDNIYRFDPASKNTYQLTSVKFGAFNPWYDKIRGRIVFNTYQQKGMDIAALKWSETAGTDIKEIENTFPSYADELSKQEGNVNVFDSIPNRKFVSKKYAELSHLFNFHSAYLSQEEYLNNYRYQLRLQSDNKLNTLSFYSAYQYNNPLEKSEYLAGFSYKRFLPVISVNYLNRGSYIFRKGQTVPVTFREEEYNTEISVPLIFNRFNNVYSTKFLLGTSYTHRYDIDRPFANLPTEIAFPIHYQFTAGRNSRRSARDLAPKWGQNIFLSYRHLPFDEKTDGELFAFRSALYFPGILNNHSTSVSFNWQQKNGTYRSNVNIPRVRGYSFVANASDPYNTLLLDYRLPLFYPDLELGPLAYIKRIKAGMFADFQNQHLEDLHGPLSYGAELTADANLLRFYLPNFDLGGRVTFINEKPRQNPIFEFIAGYNF